MPTVEGGGNGDTPVAVAVTGPLPPASSRLSNALRLAGGFLVRFAFVFILDLELRSGAGGLRPSLVGSRAKADWGLATKDLLFVIFISHK
jgi:hypothetical protein